MNGTNSSPSIPKFDCIRSSLNPDVECVVADFLFSILATVLNLLTRAPFSY